MRITPEIRDGIVALTRGPDGQTHSAIAKRIGVSAQTIGRWITGQTESCHDKYAANVCRVLGISEEQMIGVEVDRDERKLIKLVAKGKGMEPLVCDGDVVYAEPCSAAEVKEGDVVFASFRTKDKRSIRTIRMASFIGPECTLSPMLDSAEEFTVRISAIQWMSKVVLPMRTFIVTV